MAFGGFSREQDGADYAEINMIPLIDVMLVLLVIFMITAPLMTHAVKVQLPVADAHPNDPLPPRVQLTIRATGTIYWDEGAVEKAALAARLIEVARQKPQPQIELRADEAVPYGEVAQVLAAAARAGVSRIAFVTEPVRR